MSTATAEATRISVSDAGPAAKRIDITVPAASVDGHVSTALSGLQRDAAVPGFRKGKVPMALLRRKFGGALLQDVRQRLIAESYQRALEDNKIRPIAPPEMAPGTTEPEVVEGKDFAFSVVVEIMPSFDLPSWEGMAISRPVIAIGDTHVEEEIKRLSYRFGTPTEIQGPFEPLDRMVGKATARLAGTDDVQFEAEQALAVVPAAEDAGKGPFLGLLVEGLDTMLKGKKVGDSVVITMKGPEGHEIEAIRGADLAVTFEIRAAERITPATREALASQLGCESDDVLKDSVRSLLERRRDDEQRSAMRDQVFEQLAAGVDFELPVKVSESQVARDLERQRLEMLYRGTDPQVVERRMAEIRTSSADESRRRLKLFFVLARLAEQLGVEATDAEVNGRIAMIARQRGTRPAELRAELEKSGRLSELALQIREHKAADRVIAKASITDIPAEEWNAQLEARTAAASKARSGAKPSSGSASGAKGKPAKSGTSE
ncbi:MAG: trigger factor [Phycisphaerales bacterium]|nr:trigger factor [Phycisphaerales bacterium]